VAEALEKAARMSDRVYRYGGEEFVAVFVFGAIEGALIAAERMRAAVEELQIAHPGRPSGSVVTLSGGVVCYAGSPPQTTSEIISQADTALYEAKHSGKNKVLPG
jgi:diguanylate cyclase (GGDEF)-like protein